MQYELQTTLSVVPEGNSSLEDVRLRLLRAVDKAVSVPEFGQIKAFKVTFGDRVNELVVGILFHGGVRAQYIEDIGTDLLDAATTIFLTDAASSEVSEKSVRLQSVFA